MSSCCPSKKGTPQKTGHCAPKRFDWILYGSLLFVTLGYVWHLAAPSRGIPYMNTYGHAVYELMNQMWWGLALGLAVVGVMHKIPREFFTAMLGRGDTLGGILRATLGGLLLDLCSHGILLVGMKLYERGASLGQTMAFLIASPWNSLSLTIILIALIGLKWTVLFIIFSAIIAVISGLIFNALVKHGALPDNPNTNDLPDDFHFWSATKKGLSNTHYNAAFFKELGTNGWREGQMILRWIFFGVVLAAAIRTFIPPEIYADWFGPTLAGLGLTVLAATIIEICSEGSAPVAADLLTRASAPGNSFTFLMGGVSTDYTEILALRETTKSWKIAFFLPLITLPQIIFIGWLMNIM